VCLNRTISFSIGWQFTVGDIAYADAWLNEEIGGYITPLNENDKGAEYDKILNEFYNEIEEISRDVPYMVGPGEFFPLVKKILADIPRESRGKLRQWC
jgi:hypothetical protein